MAINSNLFLFGLFLFILNNKIFIEGSKKDEDEYEYDIIRLDTWPPTPHSGEEHFNETDKLGASTGPDHCLNIKVPQCAETKPSDVIFMLDASNSVDREEFFTRTLDVARDIICAYDPAAGNQYGLVLFNSEVKEAIKLAPYSHQQWAGWIEQVRNNKTNCCSCCTPLAEAFDLSNKIFEERGVHDRKLVYVLTDGVMPYQNAGLGMGRYRYPRMTPATYTMQQVPSSALKLKENGARIMVVGVKNKLTTTLNCDYYKGVPNKELRRGHGNKNMQCVTRPGTDTIHCLEMKRPPFPIVSEPVERNAFCVGSINDVIKETVTAICLAPPPLQPTTQPTDMPSDVTTDAPSVPISLAPTNAVSKSPTRKPVTGSTLKPTQTPSSSPSTNASPKFQSLDLYFVLDRSQNLLQYSSLCANVKRRESYSSDDEQKNCFGLLLDTIESLSLGLTIIGAQQPMQWKSSWADEATNAGLRVTVIVFSCLTDLKTPITTTIVDSADSLQALQEGLKNGFDAVDVTGGSCPSDAIDSVVRIIQETDSVSRPFKSLLFISDGLTTPLNEAKAIASTKGLRYFEVPSFAIGLGYSKSASSLNVDDQTKQKNQLSAITGDNLDNIIGINGEGGFSMLPSLIGLISAKIAKAVASSKSNYVTSPYCGFTSRTNCMLNTGKCEWISGTCNIKGSTISPSALTKSPTLSTGSPATSSNPTKRETSKPTTLTPTSSPTRRPKSSSQSPTNTPTALAITKNPTIRPTSSPSKRPSLPQSGTPNPTRRPTSSPSTSTTQQSCSWPLLVNGQFSTVGAEESTPYEPCSRRTSLLGCTFKNYCCWNESAKTCSMPSNCGDDCTLISDQAVCSSKVGCCTWNSEVAMCRRTCGGAPEARCPNMYLGNVKSTQSPTNKQKTSNILFPPGFT